MTMAAIAILLVALFSGLWCFLRARDLPGADFWKGATWGFVGLVTSLAAGAAVFGVLSWVFRGRETPPGWHVLAPTLQALILIAFVSVFLGGWGVERAILRDAYRELNARKLFWITLLLSGVVVAAFGAVGIDEKGVKVLFWDIDNQIFNTSLISRPMFYKTLFSNLGIGVWLAWIASILALVSTAGMIPDFISSGAIELTLSRPIGRLRLFLTKYAVGLLFVALQVAVFSACSFLVIGIRGGVWEPGLFWSVPIVLLFYSYLFSICVLLGMITRSTIASLIVTLLIWFFLFGLNTTDAIFVQLRENAAIRAETLQKRIEKYELATTTRLAKEREDEGALAPGSPPPTFTREELDAANPQLKTQRERLVNEEKSRATWDKWSAVFYWTKTVLPKTSETIDVLERTLLSEAELKKFKAPADEDQVNFGEADDIKVSGRELRQRTETALRKRSLGWVLGSSIAFELVVLAVAARIFCRRDF